MKVVLLNSINNETIINDNKILILLNKNNNLLYG